MYSIALIVSDLVFLLLDFILWCQVNKLYVYMCIEYIARNMRTRNWIYRYTLRSH